MSTVSENVEKIRQAIYGKDVRESIAASLEAMNGTCEESTAKYNQAVEALNGMRADCDQAITGANSAADRAGVSAEKANRAADAVGELGLQDIMEEITRLQEGKVDKITGKGLSTNDFTTQEKQKLENLPDIHSYDLELINGTGSAALHRINQFCWFTADLTEGDWSGDIDLVELPPDCMPQLDLTIPNVIISESNPVYFFAYVTQDRIFLKAESLPAQENPIHIEVCYCCQ